MMPLAAELPDIPRWVEVRSMLRSGHGRVIGAVTTSPLSFVVLDSSGTAGVVGRPLATEIRAAAEQAREVLVAPEEAGWAAAALPEWGLEEATLFVRSDQVVLPVFTENEARHITREELAATSGVPAGLREELLVEAAVGHLVASFAHGRPVAFCYPSSLTGGTSRSTRYRTTGARGTPRGQLRARSSTWPRPAGRRSGVPSRRTWRPQGWRRSSGSRPPTV
jgi:hypothetical protein